MSEGRQVMHAAQQALSLTPIALTPESVLGGIGSSLRESFFMFWDMLIYRKLYGARLALRMLAVFWTVMAAAGLVTELTFDALGLVPASRPVHIVAERITLNYTTVLNIVFILIFGALYWLRRNRRRLGRANGYAIDPVCGMQIEKTAAPARATTGDASYWFCSDRCRERFDFEPARFADSVTT